MDVDRPATGVATGSPGAAVGIGRKIYAAAEIQVAAGFGQDADGPAGGRAAIATIPIAATGIGFDEGAAADV